MDARGLHDLSGSRITARKQSHADLNAIIWRAIKRAQIPVAKEPVGLTRTDGIHPDGATLIPWSRCKPLTWDVTVPDTFVESHFKETYILVGTAANRATELKRTKYFYLFIYLKTLHEHCIYSE